MTEGLFQDVKKQLGKEERFLRIALIVISVIMITLDVFMFVYDVTPNNILMLLMMVPILVSVVFAWQGKPRRAVWLFSVSTWIGMIAEAAAAPQSPLDLVGVRQYLFPLMLVAFVGIFGLEKGKARTSNVLGSIVSTLISALIGHYAYKSEASAVSTEMVWVVNVLVILAALGLIYLVAVNFQRGLLFLRGSVSLKTGIGFFASSLITIGFILFTLNTDRRMAEIYDYTLYLDTEQIIISEVFAEIQAMRLDLNEYLMSTDGSNSNDAYMQHLVEYQEGSENVKLLLGDLATLQQEGMGTYTPDGRDFTIENTASLINIIGYSDSRVSQIITVIDERGNQNSGLAGELNRANRDLDNLAVFGEIPELEVLLLKMRQSEMVWSSQQELADAEAFNNFGEDALSLLKGLEISVNQRILAEQALNAYIDNFNQVVDLDKQISELSSEITRAIEPLTPQLEELIAASHTRGEEAQRMRAEADAGTQQVSIVFGIAAFVTAAVIGVFTTRTIVRPIIKLTETATEFSEGNMMARAALTSKDETGKLAGVFNQMAERLQKSLLNLEQTIVERTTELQERAREMEASQRVTFAASERTTPEDFLDLLVNLITDQFDVYHCQVYLVDEEKNEAVLSQSTGYAGRQLLQRGHAIPLDAQSLVTQCINTGESVLVAQTTNDPNWLPNPLLPLTQSELVVPLKIDDKVIGAMDIQDRIPNRFMEASLPVFESMTEQVAFLYQNNELLEEIAEAQRVQQQFVTQLETTSEVAGQLTTILDPTQLLDQAVTMLQSRFNFYHAHIYLLDEAKQNLVVAAGSGHVGVILKDRGHSIPVDAEKSFVARAFREAAPVRIVDTTKDPSWLPNPLLPDTRAEMAVPLVTRGQVIGVLDIQDEVFGRFTEVDEDTMLTLAGQLATSVDTARLFVDVERAAERDRTRFEISQALAGNPTEDQVWDALLEKAVEIGKENLMLSLNRIEREEDGTVYVVSHRTASTYPEIPPQPLGVKLSASQSPGYDVLLRGEFLVSNDVANDDQFHPELRKYLMDLGSASIMVAAFATAAGEEWEGVIGINSPVPGYFNADRVSMFASLIELGTVALRSARLRRAVADAAERDRIRFEIAEALSGNPTEEEVWDVLLEKALGNENIGMGLHLLEWDEDGQMYSVAHRLGSNNPKLTPGQIGNKQNITQNPGYTSFSKGETFISNDVANDDQFNPEIREYILRRLNASSIMLARFGEAGSPEEEWLGVFTAYSSDVGYFTPERVSMFDSLIEMGTVALRAARLRGAVANAAERDRKRFEIAEALSGNPAEEEVWDVLLEKALGDENISVALHLVELGEDGQMYSVSHRIRSNNPILTPGKIGTKQNMTQNPAYALLTKGETFISNNIAEDARLSPELRAYLKSLNASSLMLAIFAEPGSSEESWLGLFTTYSPEVGYFTPERVSMFDSLIEMGTVALRAARLRGAVSDAAERDLARFEIAEALSGTPTEEQVWDILLEKALDDNVAVTLSLADFLDEGNVKMVSHRSASNDANIVTIPVGTTIVLQNDPEYPILDFDEVFISKNVKDDKGIQPETREALANRGVASLLITPIAISEGGEWQNGVIRLSSSQPDFFNETKESKYRTLVELGSIALRSARLRASIDQAAKRTTTRLEITQALAGNLTEDDVLDILIEKAALNPDARISIYYEDLESDVREIVAQRDEPYNTGMNPLGAGYRISNDVMDFEHALKKDEIALFDNVHTDERLDDATKVVMQQIGFTSMVTIPMHMADDWLGYVFVTSKEEAFFDEEKVNLYNILAEAGTVALRAARLRAAADQERERFRVLIENAPEAIVVFNGENGEFMEANQNAVKLYEVPLEELIGSNPVALSPEAQPDGRPSAEAAMSYIKEAIDGGTPVFDWIHRTGKGREIPCEIRLVRLPGYDNPPRLRGSIADISERAAAQQAIVQGDRLKSEFLANMSHELRTPLNSILGYTDVLLMGLDGELDEEVTTDLEAIHENSQHLLNLINDILDLAKIEAGRMTIELGDVNVSQLLQEVKKTSAGLLVGKDVEMVVEADEKLPLMYADYHRVYQVVNNLVSNAVKFTEKGTITLRAVNEGDQMVLQVEDTGIGISKEDLEIIFEEFTQADTSSTRQHEGTGLGLTITRRLVQMHGGKISVESEVGKGATFTARFPLQAKVNPEQLMVVQSSNGNK